MSVSHLQLLAVRPSPIVAMNRAIAVGELRSPGAGLLELKRIETALLDAYQLFHASRADSLLRSGGTGEAIDAYTRPIDLTDNPIERRCFTTQQLRPKG